VRSEADLATGELQQRKGRALFTGGFFAEGFDYTPPETAWSAPVISSNGLFTGGKATMRHVSTFACAEFTCDDAFVEGPVTIQLTGKGKR
jgi:hypothetical protein